MIETFQLHTAHKHPGDIIATMHRLRHRLFVDGAGWDLPVVATDDGQLEYDEFDNLRATYFVWRDQFGVARGVTRLLKCDGPYMLQSRLSDLTHGAEMPTTSEWCEGTRTGVDPAIGADLKVRILKELSLAASEWSLRQGVQNFMFCTYAGLVEKVFKPRFQGLVLYGPPIVYPDGAAYQAGYYPIGRATVARLRRELGIEGSILTNYQNWCWSEEAA